MTDFIQNSLQDALKTLGQLLLDRNERYEVIAIGGGGLLLLGLINRPTKDLDLIAYMDQGQFVTANPLPLNLQQAIKEVGRALKLGDNWIDNRPSQLFEMGLPAGFEKRLKIEHYGGLILHLADRFDQICFKLYAAVDQGPESKHFADLKLLKPIKSEIYEASNWCKTHDVSEEFSIELKTINRAFDG